VDSLPKERLQDREISTDAEGVSRPKTKGLLSPAVQSVPQSVKKAAPAEVTTDEYAPIDVDFWLKQIQKECLSGRYDVDFWSRMHLQGKTILEKQAGSFSKDKVQKVSAVLALLSKMDTESAAEQCRQLLDLLAEEEKSR
jgi:hypothetical protein